MIRCDSSRSIRLNLPYTMHDDDTGFRSVASPEQMKPSKR